MNCAETEFSKRGTRYWLLGADIATDLGLSEPVYLLRPTRHGPARQGGTLRDYTAVLFNVRQLIELRTIYV